MAKTESTKPASQLWAEEQQKNGGESNKVLSTFGGDPNEEVRSVDDQNGYLGTDPIYQTAANSTEVPLRSEKGVESKLEEKAYGEKFTEQPHPGVEEPESEDDDEDKDKGGDSTSSASGGLTTGVPTPSK